MFVSFNSEFAIHFKILPYVQGVSPKNGTRIKDYTCIHYEVMKINQ